MYDSIVPDSLGDIPVARIQMSSRDSFSQLESVPVAKVQSGEVDESRKEKVKQYLNINKEAGGSAEVLALMEEFDHVVAVPGDKLGQTDLTAHKIRLVEGATPSYVPAYRIPHIQRKVVDELVEEMLQENIITPSSSPWNSPLFLVPKKNGGFRPVIDFRKVNQQTVPDRYPMPLLTNILQSLGSGNKFFSTIDLKSGYWQIPLAEESKEITAFSTTSGHYEFVKMPFGLSNAPVTFQRLMNSLFCGLIGKALLVYLDDIIIVSKTLESHLAKLRIVLDRMSSAGLKINLTKCEFLRPKIQFLGHLVDAQGIHTLPEKISAIQDYPTPVSVENVRSFLGMAGYYRSFVKGFATIAAPLTKLLRKDVPFAWGKTQIAAFNGLKEAMISPPVLAFPDQQQEFLLHTDASGVGIGAVLSQVDERGMQQPIAYASRKLNDAESRYSTTHQEALAVIWALKHFHYIIYGYDITVLTDHQALQSFFYGKELSGRLSRWHLVIMDYKPKIRYLPGRQNVVADALSRNFPVSVAAVEAKEVFSAETLREEQRKDPMWSLVIHNLESGDEDEVPNLKVPLSQFKLRDGVLCRSVVIKHRALNQIVVPTTLIPMALQIVHDVPLAGHPGREKSILMARRKYYWPTLRSDIEKKVESCLTCATHKGRTSGVAPMGSYPVPTKPWETVGVDILQISAGYEGSKYLLVVVDHFSRFTILVAIPDKSAKQVGHALVSSVFLPYAAPKVLISDNGGEFKNELLEEVCRMYGVSQCFTAAYHPQGNGMVERVNSKILTSLRTLLVDAVQPLQENWVDWIPQVAASINSTVNESTGKTPYYIMYGDEKRLPYEVVVEDPLPVYNYEDYAKVQRKVFQITFGEVRRSLERSRDLRTERQHKMAKPVSIEVGDVVMVKQPARKGKLDPSFAGPFLVVQKAHGNKFGLKDNKTGNVSEIHVDRLKKVSKALSPSDVVSEVVSEVEERKEKVIELPEEVREYRQKLRSHRQV